MSSFPKPVSPRVQNYLDMRDAGYSYGEIAKANGVSRTAVFEMVQYHTNPKFRRRWCEMRQSYANWKYRNDEQFREARKTAARERQRRIRACQKS